MYRLINMNILLLLFCFSLTQISCAQHKEKETVYLIFKHGKEANCISVKQNPTFKSRLDTTHTKYKGRMTKSKSQLPSFTICQEKFAIEDKNKDKVTEISTKDLSNLNIVDFDYFIKQRFALDFFHKRATFKNIYFLEKIGENKYKQYPVYWMDSSHNRGI